MFENINYAKEIIAIISAVLGILISGIPLLVTLLIKTKKLVEEKNWIKLSEALPQFIIEAEGFLNYSGLEKKEFVKTKLAIYALNNKIHFDEEMFNSSIDEIVALTKKVNAREKDKRRDAACSQQQSDAALNQCSVANQSTPNIDTIKAFFNK